MIVIPHWIVSDIITGLWLVWLVYWMLRSFGNKRMIRRQGGPSLIFDRIIIIAAVLILVFVPGSHHRLYPDNIWAQIAGLLICMAGMGISVWARLALGRNWSGVAMVKENHELIRGGPYRAVRHPIYSGIILALIGTVLALDPYVWAVAAVVVLAISFKIRSRREEKLMLEEFPNAYPQYMKDVKSLIPYVY